VTAYRVATETVSAAIGAACTLSQPGSLRASQRDEAVWIQEGFAIARTVAYSAPIGSGLGPFTLDDAYKAKAKKVAKERVWLAGARLANLLNNELK
jgi:hypothetical protein